MPPRPASSSMRQPANVDSRASSITGRSVTDSGVHEALAHRPQSGLRARAEAERPENAGDVRPRGSLADPKLGRDLLVGLADADKPEHLELAGRELPGEVIAWPCSERRHETP